MEIFLLIVAIIVFIGIGYFISTEKGRDPIEGVALGCLLGPIGWIIEALLPTREAPRPEIGLSSFAGYRPAVPSRSDLPEPPEVVYAVADAGLRGFAATQVAVERAVGLATLAVAKGGVVVEAVWQNESHSSLGLAIGQRGVAYARMWPTGEDVKNRLLPSMSAPEAGPATPAVQPATVAAPAAASTELVALVGRTTPELTTERRPDEPTQRPTKTCPDCAEIILKDARICKHCRHEFWAPDTVAVTPSEVPSPAPPESPQSSMVDVGVAPSQGGTAVGDDHQPQAPAQPSGVDMTPQPSTARIFSGPFGTEEEALAAAREALARASKDWVVVEAAWTDRARSHLGVALGRSGVAYRRHWPDGEDIKGLLLGGVPEGLSADDRPDST